MRFLLLFWSFEGRASDMSGSHWFDIQSMSSSYLLITGCIYEGFGMSPCLTPLTLHNVFTRPIFLTNHHRTGHPRAPQISAHYT